MFTLVRHEEIKDLVFRMIVLSYRVTPGELESLLDEMRRVEARTPYLDPTGFKEHAEGLRGLRRVFETFLSFRQALDAIDAVIPLPKEQVL